MNRVEIYTIIYLIIKCQRNLANFTEFLFVKRKGMIGCGKASIYPERTAALH